MKEKKDCYLSPFPGAGALPLPKGDTLLGDPASRNSTHTEWRLTLVEEKDSRQGLFSGCLTVNNTDQGARLLAWLLSLPLDSPFSPPGRLCCLPNPSLLYPTLWISVCSRLWRTLRELISGWICLSPFDSPFYPPGHLCLLPPSSLLYVTLWTYLREPDYGEHKGKWLLASLLSPPLIPPIIFLVTFISLLPLLFSM